MSAKHKLDENDNPSVTETFRPAVCRTSAGLRDALFDEIDRLRNGLTDAKYANALARMSSEIVRTVLMEVEVQKFTRSLPKSPEGGNIVRLLEPVPLGTEIK